MFVAITIFVTKLFRAMICGAYWSCSQGDTLVGLVKFFGTRGSEKTTRICSFCLIEDAIIVSYKRQMRMISSKAYALTKIPTQVVDKRVKIN